MDVKTIYCLTLLVQVQFLRLRLWPRGRGRITPHPLSPVRSTIETKFQRLPHPIFDHAHITCALPTLSTTLDSSRFKMADSKPEVHRPLWNGMRYSQKSQRQIPHFPEPPATLMTVVDITQHGSTTEDTREVQITSGLRPTF